VTKNGSESDGGFTFDSIATGHDAYAADSHNSVTYHQKYTTGGAEHMLKTVNNFLLIIIILFDSRSFLHIPQTNLHSSDLLQHHDLQTSRRSPVPNIHPPHKQAPVWQTSPASPIPTQQPSTNQVSRANTFTPLLAPSFPTPLTTSA
jgi:hypothetical protein